MFSLIIDLVIIGALIVLGFITIRSIAPHFGTLIALGISFPLGAGAFTWMLFIISWMGIPLTPASLIAVYLLLLVISSCLLWYLARKRGTSTSVLVDNSSDNRGDGWSRIIVLIGGLAFLASTILAVGRSYSSWDAIAIWTSKGYGISQEQTIFAGEIWGAHRLEYPLNIPLLVSSFRTLEGDILPGSKLLFPFFFLALLIGSFYFWRSYKIPSLYSALGVLFISTIPIVFEHSTIGYANLPFSVYLVLGTLFAIIGTHHRTRGTQLLGSLYLSLAVWTRPEGTYLIPITLLTILVASRAMTTRKIYPLSLITPVAVITGLWVAFGRTHEAQEIFARTIQSPWESLAKGDFHLEALYSIVRFLGRQLLEPKVWGALIPLSVSLTILHYKKFNPKRYPIVFATLLASLSLGMAVLGYFYLVSFTDNLRMSLETSMNRIFLPAVLLGTIWLMLFVGMPYADED